MKETRDKKFIYRNELDKACFQHDMAYGDFKDLARRTAADKVLRDKAFNVAKDPKYDGYQMDSSGVNNEIKQNQQVAEETHKPIIRKFKKKKSVFNIQRQYLGC